MAGALLRDFNGGEWSPLMKERSGLAKYPKSCSTMQNLIPTVQGPAERRPGTRFVAEVGDSDSAARVIDFEYGDTQDYIGELGPNTFRPFKDRAALTIPNTDAVIANGAFTSNITDWDDASSGAGSIAHDAANGRLSLDPGGATAADIGGAEQDVAVTTTNVLHAVRFTAIGAAGDKVEIQIGSTTGGSEYVPALSLEVGEHTIDFTPTGATIYVQFYAQGTDQNKIIQIDDVSLIDAEAVELTTPWAAAELFGIQTTQSRDVLYLFHPDRQPRKLERRGHTRWSLVPYEFKGGPYLPENMTATTLTPAALTGLGITVTASSIVGINDGEGFKSSDVGRLLGIKIGASYGYGIIVAFTDTTHVDIDIRTDTGGPAAAVTTWSLGLYSDTTGWPTCATFHEERLTMGGAIGGLDQIDGSVIGDFQEFLEGTDDADPIQFAIPAKKAQVIRWLEVDAHLIAGTKGGVWKIGNDSQTLPLSPTNPPLPRKGPRQRAKAAEALAVDRSILYLQAQGRVLLELTQRVEASGSTGYGAVPLTDLAEHITKGGIVDMAYQAEPWSIVWACRADGTLISMTYRRDQDQMAWAAQPLGGSGVVESLAVIPGAAAEDEVWMVVRRTIDGATKRYIEILEARHDPDGAQEDAFFVDCGLTYDGASATVISGLDHLEGEVVSVLADGATHPDCTVASGAITLQRSALVVQVGYSAPWILVPLPIALDFADPATGRALRIGKALVRFLNSAGYSFGLDADNLETPPAREPADPMDAAPPLFTGAEEITFPGVYANEAEIYLTGSDPLPATVTSILLKLEAHG